jgi:hypothetical protein
MGRDIPEGEYIGQPARQARAFTCTRRGFLPVLVREAIVTLGMMRGGLGCRLSELQDLSDEELSSIRPVVNPAFEIQVEDDRVLAYYKKTGAAVHLFTLSETPASHSFNLFDGCHTLGEAGDSLAGQMGWDRSTGFAYTRDLFLRLVADLVCVPKDPPQFTERAP